MRLRLGVGAILICALVFAGGASPAGFVPRAGHIGGIVLSRDAQPSAIHAAGLGSGNLTYHGGPVMRTNTTYAIYWIPSGYSVSTNYRSLINGFFANVAAANGASTNVYSVGTEYSDTTGPIAYHSTFAGSYLDTQPFPANGCSDASLPKCLTDAQIETEIDRVIGVKGWTAGTTHQFFMFTPKAVGSCFDSGTSTCAYSYYCAYHGSFTSSHGHGTIVYANHPYTSSSGAPGGCDIGQRPNHDDADPTINVVSHEHNEAITDPLLNAWYDAAGYEDGDKCAWNFGGALGATGGANTSYNQQIGTGKYYLQQEWSNKSPDPDTGGIGTCLQRYAPVALLTGTGAGTVTSSPAGISCTANPCDLSSKVGTTVTLTATAKPGSVFDRWSGDCTGTGTCTVTVSAATSVRARFKGPGTPSGWTQKALAPPASRNPLPTDAYPDSSFYGASLSGDGAERALTMYDARVLQPNGQVHCFYDTTDTGGVFMQRRTSTGWTADGTITAPSVYSSSESAAAPGGSRWTNCADFGRTTKLSADGSTLLVAQPPSIVSGVPNDFRCVAFVYRRISGSWTLDGTLFTPGVGADGTGSTDPAACRAFGTGGAVADNGSRVVVLGQDLALGTTADVFVHGSTGWNLEQHIRTPSGTNCGEGVEPGNVALSGNGATLLLADEECDDSGQQVVGRVYAYTRSGSTWTLAQTVHSPEPMFQNEFGRSLAISRDGSTATIGVLNSNGLPNFAGAAWVFTHSSTGWHSMSRLTETTPTERAIFSCPLPVRNGGRLFCTAYNATVGYNQSEGALYMFDRPSSGWGATATPKRAFVSGGYPLDELGVAATATQDGALLDLSIDPRTIAAGDYAHDRVGYEFGVPAAPWITSFSPAGGPVGTTVTLIGTGFSGATSVKFHGTAATSFTVVSATQITAHVPTGATTGTIAVTTSRGTGTSAKVFTVG